MTTKTYGLLAGVIGFGAWWYARRRASSNQNYQVRDRGTVIYDNTPTASELPSEA
jgi:hypothetical protein